MGRSSLPHRGWLLQLELGAPSSFSSSFHCPRSATLQVGTWTRFWKYTQARVPESHRCQAGQREGHTSPGTFLLPSSHSLGKPQPQGYWASGPQGLLAGQAHCPLLQTRIPACLLLKVHQPREGGAPRLASMAPSSVSGVEMPHGGHCAQRFVCHSGELPSALRGRQHLI